MDIDEEEKTKFIQENKKFVHDFDLNAPANFNFDLNKFPEEAYQVFEHKEFQAVLRFILKNYLPKFY